VHVYNPSCVIFPAINQEKQEVELRASIGTHDRNSLKKVETAEKDGLKESMKLRFSLEILYIP